MDAKTASAWIDQLIWTQTGEPLSALQKDILQNVLLGQKYLDIALHSGYTEGHIKDVGSQLWRVLSKVLGKRITKSTCRAILKQYLPVMPRSLPAAAQLAPISPTTQPEPMLPEPRSSAKLVPPASKMIEPGQADFVGRAAAIAHLNALVDRGCKVIVIQGEGGLGKTTLAQHYLQQGFEFVLELLMAKETQQITSVERVVEEWLKQDFQQEPGLEFGITLGRLKRQLHTRRVGILIDNLEPALDRDGRLIAPHRGYVELLRVLADAKVQAVTLITSRDRLCEPDLTVEHYRLPRLDQAAWQQFFGSRLSIACSADRSILQQLHWTYGGNAKAMGVLCGAIWEDFGGDLTAYWQEQRDGLSAGLADFKNDLKTLVASQIDRLQRLDPFAYRLLCRLGCYRYQDIPTLPLPALLALLWDVPLFQQRQVILSLRNRSLVDFEQGRYWLHPVIRAEAIARLRRSPDWEIANCKAAEFWTTSVQTIEATQDALQALEAYYHCIEIQDFEAAGSVILKSRNNQWRQFLPLGSTLYRLVAITQVISNVHSPQKLSELYNILGDLYWIIGKIHPAIACQEQAITLATETLRSLHPETASQHTLYYLKMLEVDSLLSMGLYKIDLWELESAAQLFQQVMALAQQTAHHRWAEKALVCLALVNSCLGLPTAADLADTVYRSIITEQVVEHRGRFAYFIQILGQTYANLGELEMATDLYRRALEFAEESHYTQVKARALTGLAEVARRQGAFEAAVANHVEAIALLDQIGARCDLAEAHWQLGLTQRLHQPEQSKFSCDRAIQLFTEMQAPNQVRKILKSLAER
jgi:tetratricopeptide (TPR) repeat protein